MRKLLFILINLGILTILTAQNFVLLANVKSEISKTTNINYIISHKFKNDKNTKFFYLKEKNELYIASNKNILLYKNNKIKNIKTLNNNIKYLTANNSTIIVYTKNKQLIALDKKEYKTKWTYFFDEKPFFQPIVFDNKLFIDKNAHTIIAINIKTGKFLWQFFNKIEDLHIFTNGKNIQSNQNIHYIYPNKKFLTLKKNNGEKYKSKTITTTQKITHLRKFLVYISDIELYNKTIYLCYNNGNFVSINTESGKILFKKDTKNYINTTIYKNTLIILKKNGHIKCFNKITGKKIWANKLLDQKILNKPIILNKNKALLIYDKYGYIYFIDINSGRLIQKININTSFIHAFINKTETDILLISNDKITNIKLKSCKK